MLVVVLIFPILGIFKTIEYFLKIICHNLIRLNIDIYKIIFNYVSKLNINPIVFLIYLLLALGSHFSFAEEKPVPVSASIVKLGKTNEQLPLTGSVTSPHSAAISSKVEGYVEKIYFEEGDAVKQGDVLLELDKELAEIELQRIRALINESLTREKELKRQRDEAKELVSKRHVSETAYKAASAEVDINATVIQRLRVESKRQQAIVDRHIVKAPFDGVVTDRMIEVGQWVETNNAVLELTEINQLRIEVPVPQFYFSRVNHGTQVNITYDAIPEEEFTATVSIKVPVSQQSTRTFPVMININNDQYRITPGMSARVRFILSNKGQQESIIVPSDAIVKLPDGSEKVWRVSQEEGITVVNPIDITSGKSQMGSVEIISGDIKPGDQIIVKGNEILRPGQSVKIIEQLDYTL